MKYLNYHHLLYFYLVAKEGSISKVAKDLRLSQSTISAQIKTFEDELQMKLFQKVGRSICMTEESKVIYSYAEEIFKLGQELLSNVHSKSSRGSFTVKVGLDHSLQKMVCFKLLAPLFHHKEIKVVCFEESCDQLVLKLLAHDLDIIITNKPISPQMNVKVFNHLLGESEIAVFGHPSLVKNLKKKFPENLQNAPFIFPTNNALLRCSLEEWFHSRNIYPAIKAEIEDSSLVKTFAREGVGLMASPIWARSELKRNYNLTYLGAMTGIKEHYYLISVQKKINNPVVAHLIEEHRSQLENKVL